MGTKRTEPDDAKFRQRQRYYRRNKALILAKAKLRYQAERDQRLEVAKMVREELHKRSLLETQEPDEPQEQELPWFQRLKEKFRL